MRKKYTPVRASQLSGSTGQYGMVGQDWIVTFGDTAINFGWDGYLARHVVEQMDATAEQELPTPLDDLKEIMRSPQYWRDQDPETVAAVRNAFRALYPDEEKS